MTKYADCANMFFVVSFMIQHVHDLSLFNFVI